MMKVNSDSGSRGLRAPYFYPDRRVTGAFTRKHETGAKWAKRAEYGKALLKKVSAELTKEFRRGFSEDNLSNMRKFYLTYR